MVSLSDGRVRLALGKSCVQDDHHDEYVHQNDFWNGLAHDE